MEKTGKTGKKREKSPEIAQKQQIEQKKGLAEKTASP